MKILITLLILIINTVCSGQSSQKFNLDFEESGPNKELSKDWFMWGSYKSDLDSSTVVSGKHSSKVISNDSGSFGCVAYKIPANYQGKSIKLEGYIKTEDVSDGFAGLLLRIDGNKVSLAFDNMQKQNINGTKDWQKYSVTLKFPDEADDIYVGGILSGKGKAWFDNFVLSIDGKNIQTLKEGKKLPSYKANLDKDFDSGSRIKFPELQEKSVSDLELLGKIWGFLKYHHPEIAKGNYNWDYELFRILPEYLKNNSNAERDEILLKWIDKYGGIPKCKDCRDTPADAVLKPDLSWINNSNLGSRVKEKLIYIYHNRNQESHFYIRMAPGVGNPMFTNENSYSAMRYPDEGFRLLALYRYWNMIHYFYPNKHLMDKDWSSTLKEYIPLFIHAKNELEYELATVKIIADVQDSHANLWGNRKINEWKGRYYAPIQVRFIEDKLVVTDFYDSKLKKDEGVLQQINSITRINYHPELPDLRLGDVITHINGKKVEDIVKDLKCYYPASNEAVRQRDIAADILRSNEKEIDIKFISGNQNEEKKLKLYYGSELNMYGNKEGESFKLLDNNIGYITLKTIKANDIEEIKKTFKNTKGIIIDIRNYPNTFVPFLLGSYFVSSISTPFVKFTQGNLENPGEFTFTRTLNIEKIPLHTYKGKLIVIVNEQTQSQAEYTAMAFRAGANTTIIGSTTAGADGNVSSIALPGGLSTKISGIGVYYPNGKETQRVGIIPDLIVKPTIEGIKKGKDELLEKAIEIIKKS